jgi:multiple sugar transport system permease protein
MTPARLIRGGVLAGGSLLLAVYVLAPIFWLVSSSMQTEKEIVSIPPHWIPDHPTLYNFIAIFRTGLGLAAASSGGADPTSGGFIPSVAGNLLPAMANSLIVAICVVLLNLLIGVPAAYAMAKIRFRGRTVTLYVVLATRVIPDIALVVPFFLVIKKLGLLDNLLSLIITYLAVTVPFTVFVLASFFEQIPDDLDRAARVDGCSRFQVLVRVFLPLARPALVAVSLFAFLASWNEFLLALMFTQTAASQTLPIIVAGITSDFTVSFSFLNAAGVLAVLPPVLLAVMFERHIVSGLTAGAVKG